jgi:hypothetical protein
MPKLTQNVKMFSPRSVSTTRPVLMELKEQLLGSLRSRQLPVFENTNDELLPSVAAARTRSPCTRASCLAQEDKEPWDHYCSVYFEFAAMPKQMNGVDD